MVWELLNLINEFALAAGKSPERIVCGKRAFQKIQQETVEHFQHILHRVEDEAPNTVNVIKTVITARSPRGEAPGNYLRLTLADEDGTEMLVNVDDLFEERYEISAKYEFAGIPLEVVSYQDEAENKKIYLLEEHGFRMSGLQWLDTAYGYSGWTLDYDKVKEFLCNLNNVLPEGVSPVSSDNSNVAEISDDSLISILNGGDVNDAG